MCSLHQRLKNPYKYPQESQLQTPIPDGSQKTIRLVVLALEGLGAQTGGPEGGGAWQGHERRGGSPAPQQGLG